jgi:hypothetical protein
MSAPNSCFVTWLSSYAYPSGATLPGGISNAANTKITSFQFPSKKVILFEPPLGVAAGSMQSRDKWHDSKPVSVLGFLDGHSELVLVAYGSYNSTNEYY